METPPRRALLKQTHLDFPIPPTTGNRNTSSSIISSSSLKSVYLHDWWLIKVDEDSGGRRLGVGGFASRERQAIRAFGSAAIAKRHDTITLETVDGITVKLCGFINRSFTCQNGFPPEVCNHFLHGFPYHWEVYATRCFSEESTDMAAPSSCFKTDDGAHSPLPISIDDLPVTKVRAHLMLNPGDYENWVLRNAIFEDILHSCKNIVPGHNEPLVQLKKTGNSQPKTGESTLVQSSSSHKRTKVVPTTSTKDTEKLNTPSNIGVDAHGSNKRVFTRSMKRSKNLVNTEEENKSLKTCSKSEVIKPISLSEKNDNQWGGMVNSKSSATVSHAKTGFEELQVGVKVTLDIPSVRRSGRLKNLTDLNESAQRVEGIETRGNTKDAISGKTTSDKSAARTYRSNSNVHHQNVLPSKIKKMKKSPQRSSVRRSDRLKKLRD